MSSYRLILSEPRRVNFRRQQRNYLHRHTHFEPCVVVGGHGEFLHDGQRYRLAKGDLFIADPGVDHEITSLRTRDLDLVFTAFAITEVPQPTAEERTCRNFLKAHRVHLPGQEHLAAYLLWLLDAQAKVLADEALRLFVVQVMTTLTVAAAGGARPVPALTRALQAIDARLSGPVWVADIAQAAGMSERSLRRLFQEELGRSVAAEIQERKVRRAAALLRVPEFSVKEAAHRVGIEDAAQFTRVFKKVLGVTPRQYRLTPPHVGDGVMGTEFRDAQKTG